MRLGGIRKASSQCLSQPFTTTFDKGIHMKTCTKCKVTKSLDDFHNCKSKKSGKFSHCKKCRNKYNREKAESIGHDVLYKKALERNPEKYRKKQRERYEKNKQEVSA